MKKAKNKKVSMKQLSSKIKKVNQQLDEICAMLMQLKAEKKSIKATKSKKK